MKTNLRSWTKSLALLASLAAIAASTQAASVIYDNSTTSLGQFFGSTNEFGDQIKLAGNPKDRNISQFKFEYYLAHGASGDEKGVLRIYENSPGSLGAPGNMLYQSETFSLSPGYNTIVADGFNVYAPSDNLTWTVQFTGIGSDEKVGLTLYDPPTVGSSLDDYWEKSGNTWTLKRFTGAGLEGAPIANFGAQVTAVPEPSTIALGLLGAAALLIRRRK